MSAASGSTAVMATKRKKLSEGQVWQNLELFPTPPWAARALAEVVLPQLGLPRRFDGLIWEPATGLGHLAHGLADYGPVFQSDVYQYPLAGGATMALHDVRRVDFLDPSATAPVFADWIITNPPFAPAADFLKRAIVRARVGVALLLRMQWLESDGRYGPVFLDRPPALVAQFVERVPMCEGGWDPQLSTASAYAWFVWLREEPDLAAPWRLPSDRRPGHLDLFLIPPGQQRRLTRDGDRALAARHVPGWISPRLLKSAGRHQGEFFASQPEAIHDASN